MKNEYIDLLNKIQEFDEYLAENLDIKNPDDIYGPDEKNPKHKALNIYRTEITAKLAKVGVPKTPEESQVRKQALVQLQFLWILYDLAYVDDSELSSKTLYPANARYRYEVISNNLRKGKMLSTAIDFDTITWLRIVDTERIKELIANGDFAGELIQDADSPFADLDKCEIGPQLTTDFAIYDLNPAISAKLYAGSNSYKFSTERIYSLSVIKKILKVNDMSERYWFLHILDSKDEMIFRIRIINAFKDSLRKLYATLCMGGYQNDNFIIGINYNAMNSHGVSELMKAYKTMYDTFSYKAGYVYHEESEEGKAYADSFLKFYNRIKGSLVTDSNVLEFQRGLITLASQNEFSSYYFKLIDNYMSLEEDTQRRIINIFGKDTPFDWNIFEQAIAAAPDKSNCYNKESFEDYRRRTIQDGARLLAVQDKVEKSLNAKLERSTEAIRKKYKDLTAEILSDPELVIEIAYENKL